jgi:diguanylate cyclase (GGDEF)-like protein
MQEKYFLEQLQERDRETTLVNRLTAIITSSVSIQAILEGFAQELRRVVSVDWTAIALIDENELCFPALFSTIASPWQKKDRIPLKGSATEWVATEKKSLYETDLTQSCRFWTGERPLKRGIRSIACLPLTVRGDAIGSLISASCQPNAYNPRQIRLLEQVALQIATPIENAQLYAKLQQRLRSDELTGLFNRRHFEERLKEETERHSKHKKEFSLLMLDLDSFKTYNDTYGHPSGDKLLRDVGGIIKSSTKNIGQAFRYGGDEFTVILPETTIEDAHQVAERVRDRVAHATDAREVAVTCSVGAASCPSDGVTPDELINAADTALYYAKGTGGNRVYLSSRTLSEPATGAGINARNTGLSAAYALVSTVEARDPYTYGHSRKVRAYSVALAEAIGLPSDTAIRISTAALLHDIGTIGIPDKVLKKEGKLNRRDWEVIKSHVRLGASIVGNVPGLVPCLPAIQYHHERWDGSGYPQGLKTENIPLEARILAIADMFASMTSPPAPIEMPSLKKKAWKSLGGVPARNLTPSL